jgi:hypothetical protein
MDGAQRYPSSDAMLMTPGPIIVATSSLVAASSPSIWQRRYWEHTIRDENDFSRHVDYIRINPVKHGLVTQVVDWPHSSFHRMVKFGVYPRGLGWRCQGSWRRVRRTAGRTRGEMMGIALLHHPTQSITPAGSLATLVLPRRQPHTRMGGEQRCASIAIYGQRWFR